MNVKYLLNKELTTNKILLNGFSSIVASIFSVVFGLSIVREFYFTNNSTALLVLLTLFTVLFLIFNEYVKVRELRRMYSKKSHNKLIILLTFLISFFLSGVGIYLWTNKGYQRESEMISNTSKDKEVIAKRYSHAIDSISTLSFENTPEYKRLNNELIFWKNRPAVSLKEREVISANIINIQSQLSSYRKEFESTKETLIKNQKINRGVELEKLKSDYTVRERGIRKHNYITYIFLFMILMTEMLIIFFALEYSLIHKDIDKVKKGVIGKEFLIANSIISDLLMRKEDFELNHIKYSRFLPPKYKGDWDEIKRIYNLYRDLGIKEGSSVKEAQQKLKEYYNKIVNL